ncbi:MAG: 2'-5' RNA ligase family protein [Hyphomicrobiales bacterium]|nr:2'-5' RNA ligase family protein [Hyphomicrobiales bacterium]
MPSAVNLRVDDSDAGRILALQDEAAVQLSLPSLRDLGYWPHVTLAIYDDIQPLVVQHAAAALFDGAVAVELEFAAVRFFEGPVLTLYAAPSPSPVLENLARKLHHLISPERCHPHYRPGSFVPHCTLAMNISTGQRREVAAFARRKRTRFRTTLTGGEIASFPPPRVEASFPLADAKHPMSG